MRPKARAAINTQSPNNQAVRCVGGQCTFYKRTNLCPAQKRVDYSRTASAGNEEDLQHVEVLEMHLGSDDCGKVDGGGCQSGAEEGASQNCSRGLSYHITDDVQKT